MILFFHDIGCPPLWMIGLWLIAFLSFPFFFIKGLISMIRQPSNAAFMYTFGVLFLIALAYQVFWFFIYQEISFFVFILIPFGIGAAAPLAMLELPNFFVGLLGIGINFVSIYGAAAMVEKYIDGRK